MQMQSVHGVPYTHIFLPMYAAGENFSANFFAQCKFLYFSTYRNFTRV